MNKIFTALHLLRDILLNIFFSRSYAFFFVAENHDWVIDEEGKNIIASLNRTDLMKGRITSTPLGLRNVIIHFGSVGTLVTPKGIKKVHPSNKIILSWFHVVENDERIAFIPELNKRVHFIHTASLLTKNKLINFGADASKLVVIPLGVRRSVFYPGTQEEKEKIRHSLNIPSNSIIIGSFQKDGDGWGEGMQPKMIKGPDIFCDAVEKLSRDYPVHVLLTGPARGYVKKRLDEKKIPYTHVFLKHAEEVSDYYRALDLYIISSREEGGPKAILESMASGVPLVSTRVGMSPDVIRDGVNGFLTEIGDTDALVEKSKMVLNDKDLKETIIKNALKTMREYQAEQLAMRFYYDMYKNLVESKN